MLHMSCHQLCCWFEGIIMKHRYKWQHTAKKRILNIPTLLHGNIFIHWIMNSHEAHFVATLFKPKSYYLFWKTLPSHVFFGIALATSFTVLPLLNTLYSFIPSTNPNSTHCSPLHQHINVPSYFLTPVHNHNCVLISLSKHCLILLIC